ncbi:tyrosine-type recombinase/integrase [Massilia sp. 9096]|uniref:tyrosine-type recombinase/integrase n=1 Tax=Massilia sp. 9096 TaxID=1500894 RepID=UPI0018CDDAE1|nr:tyrosine-type recombinase/integrase [Massilia sp. 9096]
MYFLDIAHLTTGDSLKTIASELSHLVRYCYNKKLSIAKIADVHIFDFSAELQKEKSIRREMQRARNNNTVRKILSRTIRFLLWYQEKFVLATAAPLIGVATVSPSIIVERIENQKYKRRRSEFYYTHRAMPSPESADPKRPIALPVIEAIEQCIDSLSVLDAQSEKFLRRYRNRPSLLIAHLEYIRSRRHFMVWLMKRTGLRPSEMVEMSLREHLHVLQSKRLLIPTKKRRRENAPLRNFPITLKDAAVFQRYLTSRTRYCAELERNGQLVVPSDALYLGLSGRPIKKSSLERDFARLVVAAGFSDIQACLSMFRHRFITYEVIVHLKEFMASSKKTAQLMTKTDYESILKRVATKTGHGSIESLWNYIDLAWKEINVWGGVDAAIDRLHAADRLFDDLLNLKRELEVTKAPPATKRFVDDIAIKLGAIIASGKEDIEIGKLTG